jgi:hypothetical protein
MRLMIVLLSVRAGVDVPMVTGDAISELCLV